MSVQQIIWTPGVSLESLIQQVVEAALSFYKGNKTATASALGISIRTLDNKLEKYAKDQTAHEKRAADAKSDRERFIARQRAIPAGAQFDNAATPSQHDPAKYSGVPTGKNAQAGVRSEPAKGPATEQPVPVPVRA